MGCNSVFKDFLKYVTLNILGQMAYSCYTAADTFFLSAALGADGLTALNLAFPVFCLINGIGLMLGMGGGTRYSILKSRKDRDSADRVFTNAVYMAGCFGVLFLLAGLFLSGPIVRLLGADDSVFSMTKTYLQVMLLFAPAFLSNNLLQCFVRNDGAPSLSMAAMITGSFSNIFLDYLFVFPLQMGIFGAILATGLSPVISMAVLSPYFFRRKNQFRLRKSMPEKNWQADILSTGVPAFVTEDSSGVVMFLFNFLILRLTGNTGVAAFGIITVISLVVVAIYTGLSQGVQPVISINYGTGKAENVKAVWKYAMLLEAALAALIYGVIYFAAPQLVSVFNSEGNKALQELAETGLRLYFLACPFIGFNIVTSTYFTSTERPRPAQAISLMRGLFVLAPMAFLLSAAFGMFGVWCAYPITECVVTMAGVVFYMAARKRERL